MNDILDYDIKQILRIQDKINLYESSELGLLHFLNDLQGLLLAVSTASTTWTNSFQKELNIIESIHESFEDQSSSRWDGDIKLDLIKAISTIKTLTNGFLEEIFKTSVRDNYEKVGTLNSGWKMCPGGQEVWHYKSSSKITACPKCYKILVVNC